MSEPSQLRKHLNFTWKHKLKRWYYSKKLGGCGHRVFIDKQVEFLRFPKNIFLDNEVVIKEGARICSCNRNAKIKIGARTTIGYHNFIFASENITIGSDCLIAPFVYIVDSNHQISREKRINLQPNLTSAVQIGSDVWIGAGAKILMGVKVGDGAVVAAGAVVKEDVAPYTIVGGIPARKISERS